MKHHKCNLPKKKSKVINLFLKSQNMKKEKVPQNMKKCPEARYGIKDGWVTALSLL